MTKDLISVIVPIYNVEKYLNKCLESIINQTYKHLEIILVDDGSTDNCGAICDQYEKKDSRIKVIHKENGGLSDARNCGIEIANGEYIIFIDSDDYVEKKFVEILYKAAKINNLKIAQCSINRIDQNNKITEKIEFEKDEIIESKNCIKELYGKGRIINVVVWNKIYSSDLFKDIRFPKGKINEDEFTTYKILYKIDNIGIIKDALYNYRVNDNSIMRKKFNINNLDVLEAYRERIEFFKEKNEDEIYSIAIEQYMYEIRRFYKLTNDFIEHSKSIRKNLLKEYRHNYINAFKNKRIKITKKIKMLLFAVSPKAYFALKNNRK